MRVKKIVANFTFFVILYLLLCSSVSFAFTAQDYNKYLDTGKIKNIVVEIDANGQKFRKNGHFIIDGEYTGGDKRNPFYNQENSRDLAVNAVLGSSVYEVYGEVDEDMIDYRYEDDEDLNATEYNRAAFEARLNVMDFGNTYKASVGYGKYNLRPGKNLTAFIKFAYNFYKNESGDPRVGCKTISDLAARGLYDKQICPFDLLEEYANKNYIDSKSDEGLSSIWLQCQTCELEGDKLDSNSNVFETLQDIFMSYVYLLPGIDKIKSITHIIPNELEVQEKAAILSLMYERFGAKPVMPERVESGAIRKIGSGDVLAALVNLENTSLEEYNIAEKIYTYMIEVKYRNNDVKLAGWLKEADEILNGYTMLSAEDYDVYMKAYREAFELYGQDTANDTLLDYGCVLTPNLFESKISYKEALDKFATTIKKHFGNSSFYHNRNNPNYVAKSYAMAQKMCENTGFCDITDIYAADMDVVTHTYGFDSSDIILLADTQVVQLQDSYGEPCDSDGDSLLDYQEAHTAELVDISDFLKEYCKYNDYTEEETRKMIEDNGKIIMYNYSSNPVLPDSDFDGRLDNRDGTKLDNEYNSNNETNNYKDVNIKFAQDYRYFFMNSEQYYEELAEMGLVLSNMASKKNGRDKTWSNNNQTERYDAHGLSDYMWYMGNENMLNMTESDVPYIIGQHDTIMLMGKVNNAERTVITVAIGEKEDYKDILAANFDGSLGNTGSEDIHHQGYDYEAEKIYDSLVAYDANLSNPRWKKAYFITGYGTGGAVANLVAKKFIDYKHNDSNIYCYTYQAPNTINRNNLTKKIHNTKYASIFNIENTDDIMLNIVGDDAGWTKYGVKKYLSVGDDKKVKDSWNHLTGKSYKGGSGFLNNLFNGIFSILRSVFGFTNTNSVLASQESHELEHLAKLFYYNKIKWKDPQSAMLLYAGFSLDNDYYLKATDIYMNSRVAQTGSEDISSAETIILGNIQTQLQPLIGQIHTNIKNEIMLNALKDIGEWFVNHLATYHKVHRKDNEDPSENAEEFYNSNFVLNQSKVVFPYNGENETQTIDTYVNAYRTKNGAVKIDDDNIEANMIFEGDGARALYHIDDFDFDSYINERQMTYDSLYGNNVDYNKFINYAGDDCSDFASAVIMHLNEGSRGKSTEDDELTSDGIRLHDTSAQMMQTNPNFEKAMYLMGFDKYAFRNGRWVKFELDNGRLVQRALTEVLHNNSFQMNTNFLEPGDLLVCAEHVEYYIGYINAFNLITRQNEWISIKDLNANYREYTEVDRNRNMIGTLKNTYACSTFGWGRINSIYPTYKFYFSYDTNNNCFRSTVHYSSTRRNDDNHRYNVIYRRRYNG